MIELFVLVAAIRPVNKRNLELCDSTNYRTHVNEQLADISCDVAVHARNPFTTSWNSKMSMSSCRTALAQ